MPKFLVTIKDSNELRLWTADSIRRGLEQSYCHLLPDLIEIDTVEYNHPADALMTEDSLLMRMIDELKQCRARTAELVDQIAKEIDRAGRARTAELVDQIAKEIDGMV